MIFEPEDEEFLLIVVPVGPDPFENGVGEYMTLRDVHRTLVPRDLLPVQPDIIGMILAPHLCLLAHARTPSMG